MKDWELAELCMDAAESGDEALIAMASDAIEDFGRSPSRIKDGDTMFTIRACLSLYARNLAEQCWRAMYDRNQKTQGSLIAIGGNKSSPKPDRPKPVLFKKGSE